MLYPYKTFDKENEFILFFYFLNYLNFQNHFIGKVVILSLVYVFTNFFASLALAKTCFLIHNLVNT